MPYIGNQHNVGDHVNNFKVLDDISSHTATFDGSATSVIDTTNNTIRVPLHRFIQGQRVTYTNGSGGDIGGLTNNTAYFISFDSANTIKLATTLANANSNTVINLSAVGSGTSHTLNVAFDGVNTKFKMTHGSGVAARLNNATQINVAINNVIQRPNLDSNNFTDGFALEDNHKIVFKTAPTVNDIFWGSIIANTIENFDLRDNEVDNFTGDGSSTEFTLSTIPANNESVIVTIDGVLQHPSDKNTTRSYTLIDSIIQFTAAPSLNGEIQVRHIGFAGASTNDVSGFYGRTGNVALTSNDNITIGDIPTVRNINASGIITATTFDGAFSSSVGGSNANFTGIVTAGVFKGGDIEGRNLKITGLSTFVGDASFSGNVSIGGTLTYEDVTNIDSVGIVTARDGIFIPNNEKLELSGSVGSSKIRLYQHPSLGSMLEFTSQSNGHIGHNASGGGKDLTLNSGNDFIFKGLQTNGGVVNIARFYKGGQRCALNADGVEKFTTSSKGIQVGTGVTIETNGQATYTGIVTATSADINGDLDVDGHTNLDNVSIAGVTTNTGILYANSSVRINTTDDQALRLNATDNGPIYMRFDRSGSRIAWFGFGNVDNNLTIRNQISDGDLYLSVTDGGSTKNAIHIDSSENAKVNILQDLDVDGHTNLDNVSIAGVTTASDNISIVKSSGPILELTTNTNAADATLRLSEGTPGSTTNGGGMFYSGADNKLHITCGTDSTTKRITILRDDGKVGIGTDDPATHLHLAGTDANLQFRVTKEGVGSFNSGVDSTGAFLETLSGDNLPIRFFTGDERLSITSGGTVNIGGDYTSTNSRLRINSTSFPETTEYLAVFKAGVANGNRFKNRYIKIRNNYTGSVQGGVPIVWEANADGSNNKAYGAVVTEGNGDIRFLNAPATSEKAIGTDLLNTISEKLRIKSDGDVTVTNDLSASIITGQQVRYSSGSANWNGHPRSVVIGYSGSNYANLGMGWVPTSTNDVYTSANSDYQSRLELYDGLQIMGSGVVVTSGQNITWKNVADFKPSAIKFYTEGNSNSEKLRIDSQGRLFVGNNLNANVNPFKMGVKETSNENAAILFLDTDNMRGGICGATKGNNELITGTTNMDFVVGSLYADTHIIRGVSGNTNGAIGMTIEGATGHIGINNTNPTLELEMSFTSGTTEPTSGTTPKGIGLSFGNTDGHNGGIWFSGDVGGDQGISGMSGSRTSNYSTDLKFYTNNTNSARAFTERLRIDPSGHTYPGADNTQDLGSDTKTWRKFHIQNMYPDQGTEQSISGSSFSSSSYYDVGYSRGNMGNIDLNGTYIVTCYCDNHLAGGGNYGITYTWIVGMRNQSTNQNTTNEVPLLSVTGHSTNNQLIELRTKREGAIYGGDEWLVWRPQSNLSTIDGSSGRTMKWRVQRIGRSSLG